MKRYLNSNWALNPVDRDWVKSMGFKGLRCGVPWRSQLRYISKMLNTLGRNNFEALLLIGGWEQWVDDGLRVERKIRQWQKDGIGIEAKKVATAALKSNIPLDLVAFEIGCEPKESGFSPREYARYVNSGAAGIFSVIPTATVLFCGPLNVDRKGGARMLDEVLDAGIDHRLLIGLHPYRSALRPYWAPRGWDSINNMFLWLRGLRRDYWISECGWHTAPQKRRRGPFGLCSKTIQWSDADVAEFAGQEMDLWENAKAQCYVWYQINDGPDPNNPEDNFGLRYHDGTPKPAAKAFQDMWEVA
jgi:hypothetical protein